MFWYDLTGRWNNITGIKVLKHRILLFWFKIVCFAYNPSEYFLKHKISKTKHSLKITQWWKQLLKTSFKRWFLHCTKCWYLEDISVPTVAMDLFQTNLLYFPATISLLIVIGINVAWYSTFVLSRFMHLIIITECNAFFAKQKNVLCQGAFGWYVSVCF